MKGFKKYLLIIIGVIIAINLVAFLLISLGLFVEPAVNSSDNKEVYSVASDSSICILYYNTEFKQKLIKLLVEDFNLQEISVTVDNISNRDQYIPADFDAVIILSGIKQFNPLPEAAGYIKKHNYADNIIYFFAYTILNNPYGLQLISPKLMLLLLLLL